MTTAKAKKPKKPPKIDGGPIDKMMAAMHDTAAFEALVRGIEHKGERKDPCRLFYTQARDLRPPSAALWSNLGEACRRLGRYEEALVWLKRAHAIEPDDVVTLVRLGRTARFLAMHELAMSSFERALILEPNNDLTAWHLSQHLLLIKDYARGWPAFETRTTHYLGKTVADNAKGLKARKRAPKTITILCDQGAGDGIQFLRFLHALSNRWPQTQLFLQAPASLHSLIKTCLKVPKLELVQRLSAVKKAAAVAIGSLPFVFDVDDKVITFRTPYLCVPKARDTVAGTFTIGLSWHSRSKSNGWQRTINLKAFAPLAQIPGVKLISLQYGDHAHKLAAMRESGMPITKARIADPEHDLLPSARAMMACDLIVTIDNTTAHLAGALGRPTIVLLHAMPHWPWGLKGARTVWYPSIKLLRQKKLGDWRPVLNQLFNEVEQRAARKLGS